MIKPQAIRRAILAAPFELDNKGEVPKPGTLFIPNAHRKALARDAVLVVGARGVGKSFWTAALSDDVLRTQIGSAVPELENAIVRVGYGAAPNIQAYPDRETFKLLLSQGHEAFYVWRAVILRWLAGHVGQAIPSGSWKETIGWVENNPEQYAQIIEAANARFAANGQFGLIVFDALDRTSNDWETMNSIVRDLLRNALWLRDLSRVQAKIFLRPDQMRRTDTSFVDASKLLATMVELAWSASDLHSMLWQRLINAPGEHGECLREFAGINAPQYDFFKPKGSTTNSDHQIWKLPHSFISQRPLFYALAGDKMGKDARRGVPYVWSVSHLADGHGWTSPRSFLAAIDMAAEDSEARYPDYEYALHYESLKRGVQKASKIRVDQVAEDDDWVPVVMNPLHGLNVPCEFSVITDAWQQAFPDGPGQITSSQVPPQHGESWDGIRGDLERLGILVTRMKDKRVDMPDLYRVGFGLGRKGGVAPRMG
ncbi:hypothetical protein [Asticcacaulis sp.]|uniref:hypothetical protein n=1 Tax=Asticcacaulis sp. TaxID=1872648 RepID=UPI002617F641|nr:hypothetical protein [Asticcacaulis sp.]